MDPAALPRDREEVATEDMTTAVADMEDTADTMTVAAATVEVATTATTATDVVAAMAVTVTDLVEAATVAVEETAEVTRTAVVAAVATVVTATAALLPSPRKAVVVACRPSLPAEAAVATLLPAVCTRTVGA